MRRPLTRLLPGSLVLVAITSATAASAAQPAAPTAVDRLAIVDGVPQSLAVWARGEALFVSLDQLFTALRWKRCGERCVMTSEAAGADRRWQAASESIETVEGAEFANLGQLDDLFGLRAGWDRFDKYIWVLSSAPLPRPSRDGPNIPIPSKNYGPFDDHGIPMKDHGASGVQYNPLVVLEYASVYFRNFLDTGDDTYRAAFFRMIDWLRGAAVPVEGASDTAAWYYDFDWPPFARRPFLAGITQAYSGSAFIDAYLLSADATYLDDARRAMAVLKLPTSRGGVYSSDKRGAHRFIEEYPSEQPSRVLGGCIEAMLRLSRYLQYAADPELQSVYDETLATLRETLPLYDAPEAQNSRYALSQEVQFRLTTTDPVRERHPVSIIRVVPPDDEPYELEVGDATAADRPGYRIAARPTSSWSAPGNEDGRAVRAFERGDADTAHALFYLRLSGFLRSATTQTIEIEYRDISSEAVHVEVFSESRGFVRLGTLAHDNDGRWKTATFSVTPETVGQSNFGLLAPGAYSSMHVGWLLQLAAETGEARFAEYASKWELYLTRP